MKIVAICQCLDLGHKELGITPAWWQILKGLHELGVEVVAVPYYEKAVSSLWWSTYENPNLWKNRAYTAVENAAGRLHLYKARMEFRQKNQGAIRFLVRNFVRKKWEKYVRYIMKRESQVDAVIVLTVPLNQFTGVPTVIKKEFNVPVIFYDGDTPTSLPSYGGLSFSFYNGADPSEYDAFIINSKGAADEVKKLGAKEVQTVYWGVDPGVFSPIDGLTQTNDVGFYGVGSKLREEWITRMMVNPSAKLRDKKFRVCGEGFNMNMGQVELVPFGTSSYRRFSCETKINLNIVRKPHAEVYASSISRVFELASMGCCIISNPQNGIQDWFNVGKEVLVATNDEELLDWYSRLLSDEDARVRMGTAARERVLREHTHTHRAKQIIEIVKRVS